MLIIRLISYLTNRYNNHYLRNKINFLGKESSIISPLSIDGENIWIGNNVTVQYKTWLAAMPLTESEKCELIIKDGCVIGHFNEIYATNSIIIEEDVLTADRVYISDNLHKYEDIELPVKNQGIKQLKNVVIGKGSWIGVGVAIMGANIGKHCVIGANSVVTKDIPDYCVAVGAPARIIKRYDFQKKEWRKTDKDGNFLE